MKYWLYAIILFAFTNSIIAQDTLEDDSNRPFSFGIFGGSIFTNHTADFYDLPPMNSYSSVDKQKFTGGNGINPSFGLFANYRFGSFILELKGLYQPISVTMETKSYIGLQEYQGKLISLYSQKTLKPKLDAFTIAPYFYYSPDALPNLKFGLSPEVSILMGKTLSFKEELIGDDGVQSFYFQDAGTTVRDEIPEGTEISNATAVSFNIAFELGYSFNLSKDFEIIPSLGFSMGLNDLAKDVSWKYNAFRCGVSFAYRPDFSEPKIKACPKGFNYDEISGECVPKICDKGYVLDDYSGDCVPKTCRKGFVLDTNSGDCVPKTCDKGYVLDAETGDCVIKTCPKGYSLSLETGECVEKSCPKGYAFSPEIGDCVEIPCPDGQIRDANGDCIAATPDTVDKDECKGTYLALSSWKTKEEAENDRKLLTGAGIKNIKVELQKYLNNPKNIFYIVITACYNTEKEALAAKREINKILKSKNIKRTIDMKER